MSEIDELRDMETWLILIEDALEGGTPQISNQGQALDGYSALANFRSIAQKAKENKAIRRYYEEKE